MLQIPLTVALAALSSFTAATPIDSTAQGSKHTFYLTSCAQRCTLGILCDTSSNAATTFSAIVYYANGASTSGSTLTSNPTSITTISTPAQAWDGTQRAAIIGRTAFSSNIDVGANVLLKGQIAGSAKLGAEEFVCFRDGETTISGSTDLGIQQWSCKADYWCPSISVSK